MKNRSAALPLVERKLVRPVRIIHPEVTLHPSVGSLTCGKCTFLDQDAKYCELLDEELRTAPSTRMNVADVFQRHPLCKSAESE